VAGKSQHLSGNQGKNNTPTPARQGGKPTKLSSKETKKSQGKVKDRYPNQRALRVRRYRLRVTQVNIASAKRVRPGHFSTRQKKRGEGIKAKPNSCVQMTARNKKDTTNVNFRKNKEKRKRTFRIQKGSQLTIKTRPGIQKEVEERQHSGKEPWKR